MSFSELPEEIFLQILDKFPNKPLYSQQFVMLHVNKFCCKTTTKWFKNNHTFPNCEGRDNLLLWACSFKRKNQGLSLIKWAETFSKNFTPQCFAKPIKNNHRKLIDYLLLKQCPVNEYLLGVTMYYDKIELFDYFTIMRSVVNIPIDYDPIYFSVNAMTYSYLIECLAVKGNYNLLKKYLQYKYHFNDGVFRKVLMSKFLHNKQKLKILKLLDKYQAIQDKYICRYAIEYGDNEILEWMLMSRFGIENVYMAAATQQKTKVIILLLKYGITLTPFDVKYIKYCLEKMENNEDVDYILSEI